MKKVLTLILTLCLILQLSACMAIPELPIPDTTAAPTAAAPETKTPVTAEPETEAPTAKPTEPKGESAPEGRGVIDGDVYVNEGLNLKITLPQGCVFYTEEQMAQTNNMNAELFSGSDLADIIANAGQLIDVIFANAGGDNTNMLIQANNPALSLYTMEQVFQLSEDAYRTQFSSAGMEVKTYEPVTVRFLGEDVTALHMVLSHTLGTVEEYQIWAPELSDDYMAIITVSSSTEGSDPQPMLDAFSRLH